MAHAAAHIAVIESFDQLGQVLIAAADDSKGDQRDAIGLTVADVVALKRRRISRRLYDDVAYTQRVEEAYSQAKSKRAAPGGWDTEQLAWPSTADAGPSEATCDFDELDPATLTREDFEVLTGSRGKLISHSSALSRVASHIALFTQVCAANDVCLCARRGLRLSRAQNRFLFMKRPAIIRGGAARPVLCLA